MTSLRRGHKSNNLHAGCHLGVHDWSQIRHDDGGTHYACRFCDNVKVANDPWWDFSLRAGVGFH